MKVPSNKAIDVFKYYRDLLTDIYGTEEATSLMTILFEHFLALQRHEILSGSARRISESELLKIHFATKELLKQRPVQYITGTAWFYGNAFKVNNDVLIPRPETEELCDWIIKDSRILAHDNKTLRILDIGTGSGCIAVTLKQNIENAQVSALDVSDKALGIARTNATALAAEIEFIKADILKSDQWPTGNFDIIVSNPPYVRESEKEAMQSNVLEHEPHLALFVSDEKPLVFYEVISKFAHQSLSEIGKLYFEINESLRDEMNLLMEKNGFEKIEFRTDLRNKIRMMACSRKNQ
ncbi:MAG: peptide chain release factor N(5)-glutamine methyltransferase [Bacteroidota bacterium]|nr:peptide chain release factor N(5)-glutamine methyltransferase [Bacteroidota bacterium]